VRGSIRVSVASGSSDFEFHTYSFLLTYEKNVSRSKNLEGGQCIFLFCSSPLRRCCLGDELAGRRAFDFELQLYMYYRCHHPWLSNNTYQRLSPRPKPAPLRTALLAFVLRLPGGYIRASLHQDGLCNIAMNTYTFDQGSQDSSFGQSTCVHS
jgi:hypothetical protein